MDTDLKRRLLEAMIATVREHRDELTDLDRAIGDADHGSNLERGFDALAAQQESLAASPLPAALADVGLTLVMTVGGASGPLFGTFFMELGKVLDETPTRQNVAAAFSRATAAVAARGKSTAGQKTLLDVLEPVAQRLAASEPAALAEIAGVAAQAAQATVPLVATRGRASFLGARSAGHMDPGARSTSLLIAAACTVLEGGRA
jgi:dihydroxyacetone kinase-like protein